MSESTLNRTQVVTLLNFFESNKSIVDQYPGKEDLKKVIDCLKSDSFFMDNVWTGNSWVKGRRNCEKIR